MYLFIYFVIYCHSVFFQSNRKYFHWTFWLKMIEVYHHSLYRTSLCKTFHQNNDIGVLTILSKKLLFFFFLKWGSVFLVWNYFFDVLTLSHGVKAFWNWMSCVATVFVKTTSSYNKVRKKHKMQFCEHLKEISTVSAFISLEALGCISVKNRPSTL